MSRFANLADKPKGAIPGNPSVGTANAGQPPIAPSVAATPTPPSRIGRKAIAAYFSVRFLSKWFTAKTRPLAPSPDD